MSLLPEEAGFAELVQDCYLAYRGAGLMLSPLDSDLLSEWSDAGVPFEVVARGIRKAAERALWDARPGEPALHSLRACRREVNAEIRKFLDRSAGGGETPSARTVETVERTRHKRLRAALRKIAQAHPPFAPAAQRLLEGPCADAAADLAAASRREELAIAVLTRALPFAQRSALTAEVHARAAQTPALSARARRMSRRFHREALLRMKHELPSFW